MSNLLGGLFKGLATLVFLFFGVIFMAFLWLFNKFGELLFGSDESNARDSYRERRW